MYKKIGIVALLVIAVLMIVMRDKIAVAWHAMSTTDNDKEISFVISQTMDVETLAKALVEADVVDVEKSVLAIGRYKQLTSENIALGMYRIQPRTSIRDLLNGFTLNGNGNGNAEVEVDVIVPNVRFLSDLGGKLAKQTIIDSATFVQLLEKPETLAKYGFTKEQFPAMFLPNTYKLYFDTDEDAFLSRMAKEFKNYWTAERKSKLASVGLKSPSEAVTLASIVYSEQSKQTSEWPIIAGLYLNRINKGIMLQSDPTFKFCWGKELDTVQRLLNKHREIDCEYNTYKIQGLPPGPICIPPIGVVSAVLNPDKNDYIFMCAQPSYSGFHNFAKDYSKHNVNAKLFQRWLAAELAENN